MNGVRRHHLVTRDDDVIEVYLCLRNHVISEDADVADLDLDDIAGDHVPVRALGSHPEHVTGVEGGVATELLNPGRRVPDLLGRREILPYRAVMTDGDAELCGVEAGHNPGSKRFEGVTILAAKHRPIGLLPWALTDIVADAVAEDAI